MKNVFSKIIAVLCVILIIIFSIIVLFLLFNSLVAYKSASPNDLISFAGGIVGSIIAGLIAVVTFYCTIKNNNKNQKEAQDLQIKLNIENNNLQASLKVQDNLNRKMEKERSVLAATYNYLESFLFAVSNVLTLGTDFIEMKKDYLRLYKEVISSINNIRFNSEIFDDRSFCENCEMCEIKTTGALVKSAAEIQKEMVAIDEECRIVLGHLESALNTEAQSKQLIDEKERLQQINNINERIIEIKKFQIANLSGASTSDKQIYGDEIVSITTEISENNQKIEEIKGLLDSNSKIIGEQSALARNKARQIDEKNKLQLRILIQKYFSTYNLFISETVYAVQKNGKKPNSGCAKLDFEKNHTEKKNDTKM